MEVIGLIGHQGVGKNFIAEQILPKILPKKNTVVLAFADHFKVECITKHDASFDKVFGDKDFETRKILQKVGTEEGRNVYGYDIWIKTLHTWIKVLNSRGVERFIISDVRFINEAEWIKSINGKLIKIEANERFMKRLEEETNNDTEKINTILNHPSEKEVDLIDFYDFCLHNNPDDNDFENLKAFLMS